MDSHRLKNQDDSLSRNTLTPLFKPLLFLILLGLFPSHLLHGQEPPAAANQFESVEERRLIDSIKSERSAIEEERQRIELRKNELKSIEEDVDKKLAEIDAKLAELTALRQQIEKLLAAKSEEEMKRTRELAKIYDKMSPDRAAQALSGLQHQLAADILANMKVKAAAKVLDQISQQKARDISTTFSTLPLE
ncbi:MAG: MotE family protein [Desulfopila sp.]